MMNKYALLIVLALLAPNASSAHIIFSEIAWMGSTESANHEWIELTNTGNGPVSVEGWRITAADGSPDITLTGTIPGLESAVLERTSDDSASGIAFLIYTGSLSNNGENLTLQDDVNTTIDSISSIDGWIGGDNATKETLQLIDSAWVTAPATPGTYQTTTPKDVDEEVKPAQAPTTASSAPSDLQISGSVSIPEEVLVHESFLIHPVLKQGVNTLPLGSIRINFGDGAYLEQDGELKAIQHQYTNPGTYRIHYELRANAWQPEPNEAGFFDINVVTSPITLSIKDDHILISTEKESHDVSGWTIVDSSGDMTTLPPLSITYQDMPLLISKLPTNELRILDRQGVIRGSMGTQKETVPPAQAQKTPAKRAVITPEVSSNVTPPLLPQPEAPQSVLAASPLLAQSHHSESPFPWWPLGLVAILLTAVGLLGYLVQAHHPALEESHLRSQNHQPN